jgi:hypothetical protein
MTRPSALFKRGIAQGQSTLKLARALGSPLERGRGVLFLVQESGIKPGIVHDTPLRPSQEGNRTGPRLLKGQSISSLEFTVAFVKSIVRRVNQQRHIHITYQFIFIIKSQNLFMDTIPVVNHSQHLEPRILEQPLHIAF